jgi:transcriptional regulator NrdR family protein
MEPITAYLAGPFHNCNDKQKTEWRKEIRQLLAGGGYKWVDPADHTSGWTPLKEIVDIERSDVVIANLWKESIGTVVGILQAASSGKPVILIDINYLESHVLRDIVGENNVVRTVAAAFNKLDTEIRHLLRTDLQVEKNDGTLQPFNRKKLQRSLNLVCSEAKVSDTLLPVLVSHRVSNILKTIASTGVIKTSQIADFVLGELKRLATQPDARYSESLNEHARRLSAQWQQSKRLRHPEREVAEHHKQIDGLREENRRLNEENNQLKANLRDVNRARLGPASGDSFENGTPSARVEDMNPLVTILAKELAGKQCLCFCHKQGPSFRSVFQRKGLSQEEFARFFVEQQRDGLLSNLNVDVKAGLRKYAYVLYAGEGLKHLLPENLDAPNLFRGKRPNDVVRKFIFKLDPTSDKE